MKYFLRFFLISLLLVEFSSLQAQSFLSPSKSKAEEEVENIESPRFMFRRFLEILNKDQIDAAFPFVELPPRMQLAQKRASIRQLFDVLNKKGMIDIATISNNPQGSLNDLADPLMEDIGFILVPNQNVRVMLKLVTDKGKKTWKFSDEFMERVPEISQILKNSDFENKLPSQLTANQFLGIKIWQWMGLVVALVLSYLVAVLLSYVVFFAAKLIVRRLKVIVPDEIYTNFITPLRLFITIFAFSWLVNYLDTDLSFRQRLNYFEAIALTLSFCIFALRMTSASVELMRLSYDRQGKHNAIAMLGPFKKGMGILIVVLGMISLMRNLGFDVTAIIAGLGIGGVAIALAGQKTIENLFGGISIVMDQPVRVGDFGKFGEIKGTVEDIGLRSTKVRTLDRTLVSIPNAEFSHMVLENFEKRDKFRWHAILGIRMDTTTDQMRLLLMLIKELMLGHPMVYKDPARARFISFAPGALNIEIFAYIKAIDHDEFVTVLEDLNLRTLDIIRDVGTDLAYPSQTLFIEEKQPRDTTKLFEVEKRIASIKDKEGFPQPYYPSAWSEPKIDTLEFPEKP